MIRKCRSKMALEPLCCPICSDPPRLERPLWFVANRTTKNRKVQTAFLSGCPHVVAIFGVEFIEEQDADAAILRWNTEAVRLFETQTQTVLWTDTQRAAWRTKLGFPLPAPVVGLKLQDIASAQADTAIGPKP
jgi:hypothetical protein